MGAAATEGPPNTDIATCGAKTRSGLPCKRVPGFGTEHLGYGHCKSHGGSSHSGAVHAARLHAASLAIVRGIDPHEALLEAVAQASIWERKCRDMVADLEDDDLTSEYRKTRTGPDGTTVEQSNERRLNVWVGAHLRAVRDLASIAKTALDAGVEERRVRVAEQFGSQIAELMGRVFAELDLTDAQRELAPTIVGRHLRALEAGPAVAGMVA